MVIDPARKGILGVFLQMNKKTFLIITCVLFVLSYCRVRQAVLDLKEESAFAHEEGGIFAVSLLEPEGEPYVMGGWSTVRVDGTRLGVFPISRIKIPAFKKESLYLFFKCTPFDRDQHPAEGFQFRMKNKVVSQVDLEPETERLIKISLPPNILDLGDNVLQIHHILAPGTESKIDPGEKKRIRTTVFYEMLLSSHPDYQMTKRFTEAKLLANLKHSDYLVQKIPSTLDFYTNLPDNARFEASYKFLPADPSDLPFPIEMKISLQEQESDEEIIHRASLGGKKAIGRIGIDLPAEGRIFRLRIQAGGVEGPDSFAGLLVWRKASIGIKAEKKLKRTQLEENFVEWKQCLADKNAIIIILDAARADHFSCYGYYRPTTPNLDKFAKEAVLFTNAYSESLTTRCSIGTLFTGFPLTVLSLYDIGSQIPEELPTLAQLFQPINFKTTGFAGVGNVGSSFGFGRGFDQYFELYKEAEFYRKSQEYLPYLFPWLESNRNNRFFLYVHFKEPHANYVPLPPFKGMFTDALEEKADLSVHLNDIAKDLTEGQIEYVRAGYDENLASVDSVVGELIEKMRSLDMLDDSIIIVTADHGELLGERDKIFGHGGYFGEGGMHIPLLIRFPKSDDIKIPEKVDALVKTSDLFATLSDIYQFDILENYLSGKSLLPLIREPGSEINPYMVSEKRGIPGYCYRNKQHKLIYWMEDALIEFYDLEKDPEAMNNVYGQNKISANYYLTNIKKWITSQNMIKDAFLKGDPAKRDLDLNQIDEKTLENLKALGYIK
jgi:arylsulfatase A-like enzyme